MESKKFDSGKPPISLIPHDYLVAVAEVLAFGAAKYDKHNWRQTGFDWSRLLDAAYRHLGAFNDGEDRDPESGLSHLAHAACTIMFLVYHERQKLGTDDRFKAEILSSELSEDWEVARYVPLTVKYVGKKPKRRSKKGE